MLMTANAASSTYVLILWIVLFGGVMYFTMYRPQKKEQKRVAAMLSSMEVGDVVVTTSGFPDYYLYRLKDDTSGFYGVLIDITDDDVIVEFGSNRNCRIPMKKAAIQQVEKQD